jgi:RNA polymerase sigma-70 factor (ECF subfamily)
MSSLDEKTDEEIARIVQSGENNSFGILIKRYEDKMLRYAKRFLFNHDDAEDLIQEVFLKAYNNIQSFNTSKKFSPWLYRIAHNEFINEIKRKGKEPLSFFNPDVFLPHTISKENPENEIHKKEFHHIVNKYLYKLEPKYREPLVLYYFEDLSYKEIADILYIPSSTVGVRIKRARDIMKKMIKKIDYIYGK